MRNGRHYDGAMARSMSESAFETDFRIGQREVGPVTSGVDTAVGAPRWCSSVARTLVGITVFMWVAFGWSPAFADEFEVGILIDSAVSEGPGSAFLDGFQLAVDQSPDVSHPAGTEGGDHLGSMDVVMVVGVADNDASDLLDAAIDMADREGLAIIVADVSGDVLTELHGPITGSETFLIVMSDTDGVELPVTPYFFAAGDREGLEDLLTDQVPAFAEAFLQAYGYSPPDAASRGYLAGRLVDISVEATNRDPTDVEALAAALLAAAGPSEGSLVDDSDSIVSAAPATSAGSQIETDRSAANGALITTIIVALVAIGGVAFVAWRWRQATIGQAN